MAEKALMSQFALFSLVVFAGDCSRYVVFTKARLSIQNDGQKIYIILESFVNSGKPEQYTFVNLKDRD